MEDIVSGILWESKVAIYVASKVIRWVKHLSPNTTHNTQTTENKCTIKKKKTQNSQTFSGGCLQLQHLEGRSRRIKGSRPSFTYTIN